jgi:hypothetical protein
MSFLMLRADKEVPPVGVYWRLPLGICHHLFHYCSTPFLVNGQVPLGGVSASFLPFVKHGPSGCATGVDKLGQNLPLTFSPMT